MNNVKFKLQYRDGEYPLQRQLFKFNVETKNMECLWKLDRSSKSPTNRYMVKVGTEWKWLCENRIRDSTLTVWFSEDRRWKYKRKKS